MFKFQLMVQQGSKFAGSLFKENEHIGGLGHDENGCYVNLTRELTVNETMELMSYIKNISSTFGDESIRVRYIES